MEALSECKYYERPELNVLQSSEGVVGVLWKNQVVRVVGLVVWRAKVFILASSCTGHFRMKLGAVRWTNHVMGTFSGERKRPY